MNNEKKILIICWQFPPNPGIGGRRWAKFAKYLINEGYEVFIIKHKYQNNQNLSQWYSGLNIPEKNIYEINAHFLTSWLKVKQNSRGKIKYKIASVLLNFFEKGTIYDSAVGIKNNVVSLVLKVIKLNNIQNVVVTGAPFNLLYYCAIALQKLKNIVSIADYRDPWLDAINYGMRNLEEHRKNCEVLKQNLVLETFTYVTAPSDFFFPNLKAQYTGIKGIKSSFIELKHAFDIDDIKHSVGLVNFENKNNQLIRLVYGGTIYGDSEPFLEEFSEFIVTFNKNNSDKKLEAILYTPDFLKFNNKFSGLIFKRPIGNDIFLEMKNSDFVILLHAQHNMNFKTSKLFEYISLNKPFFYIGPQGAVSDMIEENKMGIVFRYFDRIKMNQLVKQEYKVNFDSVAQENDFAYRTKQLIKLLQRAN